MEASDAELLNDLALCKLFPGWTLSDVRSLDELERFRIEEMVDGQSRAQRVISARPAKQ